MKVLDVTTMSSKGQVVIPTDVRRGMGLANGAKLMVVTDGNNLLLKPIEAPRMKVFESLIRQSRQYASAAGLKRSDLAKAIHKVRRESRP